MNIKEIVEILILPPGLFILAGIVSLGLCSRWTGRVLFLLNLSALYFLSIPVVGTYLVHSLEVGQAVSDTDIQSFQPQVILVPMSDRYPEAPEYGGTSVDTGSLERLRYAAYLHRRTGLRILLMEESPTNTGTPLAATERRILEQEFRLPETAVTTASDSDRERAPPSGRPTDRLGAKRVLLVTHGWHMARMADRLRNQGLQVLPAPTAIVSPVPDAADPRNWIPRFWALELSYHGVRERLEELWSRLHSLLDW